MRLLRWLTGVDTRAKVVALCFTVVVAMILRNELVILIARAGWSETWTRVGVYGAGFLTYVVGSHVNAYVFGREDWK